MMCLSYERAMYGIEYARLGMLQYTEKQRSRLRPKQKSKASTYKWE